MLADEGVAGRRYLEVQSSGRRDEVRLHYVAAGGAAPRVETFPFRLADGAWHRLALAVSGAQATLLVDCHPLYRRLIPPPDRNFTQPQLALWVGQRNSKHSLFKVCTIAVTGEMPVGHLAKITLSQSPSGHPARRAAGEWPAWILGAVPGAGLRVPHVRPVRTAAGYGAGAHCSHT